MKKSQFSLFMIGLFGVQAAFAQNDAAATQQLDTVNVRGKAQRSFSQSSDGSLRDRVNLGLLGKQNAFTAPITVVNYDEKIINDSQARTLVDVIAKKDVSTWQFGGESNTLTGLYFRGFQLDARQFSVNGLVGMYGTQGTASAHVASAQLIKGSSSAITGMDAEGAVSGALNIETKKASDEGNRRLSLGYFEKNRFQAAADLGQRFGINKEWGVRFNTKWRKGDTPRENYHEKNQEYAINADYRGEQLKVAFDSVYAKREAQGGRSRLQDIQNAKGTLFAAPDGKTNLLPAWQYQDTTGKTNMLTFEYDTQRAVQITGGVGYNDANYKGLLTSPTVVNNGDGSRYNTGTSRLTDQKFKTFSGNLSLRGQFDTGSISHSWNLAYDHVNRKRQTYRGTRASSRGVVVDAQKDIAAQLANMRPDYATTWESTPSMNVRTQLNSLAISDTLGLADNKVRLTLGGRLQKVEQEDKIKLTKASASRFSPMLMAAFVPSRDLAIYGNYMEDLETADMKTDEDGNTTMPKPRVTKQIEMGVRKNWGDVVSTISAFQVSRPGYWRNTGDAQGKERNRGIEVNVYGNLLNRSLRPQLGVMYLDSKVKDYPNYQSQLVSGVQVANPKILAKAGVEWDTPFAKDLTLHANLQYFGKSYQDTQKNYAFPAYTLVDVGAKYGIKLPNQQTLTLHGTVENVFNKKRWEVQRGQYDRSFAVVGMPRTFWLKADYTF